VAGLNLPELQCDFPAVIFSAIANVGRNNSSPYLLADAGFRFPPYGCTPKTSFYRISGMVVLIPGNKHKRFVSASDEISFLAQSILNLNQKIAS
jgi:hypothetical protein